MAILEKIRNRGLLLVIVVGGALLAFILTEFINSRSSGPTEEGIVGSIYGEDIKINEFSEVLNSVKQNSIENESMQNLRSGM